MFFLKKIITPFIFPPGVFIAAVLLSGIFFLARKRLKAGWMLVFFGTVMWIAATGLVFNLLCEPLEAAFDVPQRLKGDVIIVLGGGINEEAADVTGVGTPSPDLMERIVGTVTVYNRMPVSIIASGGHSSRKISEATVIKRYLMELGVPQHMIIVEGNSRNTMENATYSKAICEMFGFTSPVVVTSDLHMRRAVASFRKIGLDVTPVPVGSKAGHTFSWRHLLPADYRTLRMVLWEYVGYVYYELVY